MSLQANELRADELPVACMANELRAHGSERQHGKQAHMANKLRAGELRAGELQSWWTPAACRLSNQSWYISYGFDITPGG